MTNGDCIRPRTPIYEMENNAMSNQRSSTAFSRVARLMIGLAVMMAAATSQAQMGQRGQMAPPSRGQMAAPTSQRQTSQKPTIILVHGAFQDATTWQGVIRSLESDGYPVIAWANPLRSVKGDSSYLASLIDSVKGPVILVGHSFSGMLITNAAAGKDNVKGLVYVAALAPDAGETAQDLLSKFPGGTSGSALGPPVTLANGSHDLYVQPEKFHDQFAADVPAATVTIMAATQRPICDAAFGEQSGTPAWKSIPSYFIHGTGDKNLPLAAVDFMAKRAGAKKVVEIKGASHELLISHAKETAKLIVEAAQQTVVASVQR
jgi:pimeloyl-ACP methyl ester carboxylesterase